MFLAVLCSHTDGAVFHRQVLHGFSTDDLQRRMGGRAQQLPWCLHLTQMIEVQPQCGPQSLVRTRLPAYRFSLACTLISHTFTRAASHTLSLCHASIGMAATFSSSLRTTSSRRSAPSGRCVVRAPRTVRLRVLLLALNLLGVPGCRLHGRAWGVRCPACLRLSPPRQSESLTRILRDQQNTSGAWLASMA